MEVIKQWIICIIICSIVTAVVTVISPSGNTARALKTVVAVFMVCAFLSPFFDGNGVETDFELPDFQDNEKVLTAEITESMLNETENQAVIKIEELLESLSVNAKEIHVYADVNKDNIIYIEYISLTISEKFSYREKQIASNLKSMFSSEVEFIWVRE